MDTEEAKTSYKLLLVEDEPQDVECIKGLLLGSENILFEIEVVDTLSLALERLSTNSYDVILLDLSLPDSRGFETLRSINYRASGMPVVVLSVIDDETLARKIFREGAQGYLVKGHIDSVALLRTLEYALEHKRLETSLNDSQQQYRTTVDSLADALHVVDEGLRIVLMNKVFKQWNKRLGLITEVEGRSIFEVFPFLSEVVRKEYEEVFATGKTLITEEKTQIEGKDIVTETRKIPVFKGGKVVQVITVIRDITESRKLQDALRENERFLNSVFMSIQDGVSVLDNEMNIIRVNAAMEKWYSHAMPLVGKKCYQAYHDLDKPCAVCPTALTLKTKQAAYEVVPKRGPQGEIVGWLDLYSFPLFDSLTGKMQGVIEYVRDISSRVEAEKKYQKANTARNRVRKKLKELSLYDSDTGLFNHRYLEKAIEIEFHRAQRYCHPFSVIILDIDYFKSINDVFGHKFGDKVLLRFARQLKMMLRRCDILVRLGGEEFLILLTNLDRAAALNLAQRLLNAINLYNFGDKRHTVKLKVSLGVASYPEDKVIRAMDLVNLAEDFMDKAKEKGGNQICSCLDFPGDGLKRKKIILETKNIAFLQDKLAKLTKKTNQNLIEAIFALSRTIELKDRYTGEHVERTVSYAIEIARKLGLSREEQEAVRQAAMLHDLGKIGIPEKILLKKGRLTPKEFELIKRHPEIGADILRPIQLLHNIIPYIYYHHERWDGKGYLQGLKGEDIPLGARIIAIADVFQALTSDRPYRKAHPFKKAIQIIESGAGTQFDPHIVKIFLSIVDQKKNPAKS